MRPFTLLAIAWLLARALQGAESPPMILTPDFSHAGYRGGDATIPTVPVVANVRDFGAIGDGEADDTAAFAKALATAPAGAVLVPAGRYRITGLIELSRSGTVLRGEGADRSVLWFPRTLTDVKPNWGETTSGRPTSNYSWSSGFIVIGPTTKTPGPRRIDVIEAAERGGRSIRLANPPGLAVDDEVVVAVEDDAERTLTHHLYAGDPGPITKLSPLRARQIARIAAIDGDRVTLDRPLRQDLRPAWKPRLSAYAPPVRECGIEDLGLAFPATPYEGHFTELGFNGVELRTGSADCWVRGVTVANGESGIYVQGDRSTVSGFTLIGDKPSAPETYAGAACIGHHGISVGGSDNLITGFDFRVAYIHDISVEGGTCAGNVFAGGRGVDLCFDHHKKAPHANLFTDIDCGLGGRIWMNGGGADLGRPCGAWTVFWNLRAQRRLAPPPAGFAPAGMVTSGFDGPVEPRDLHAAQLATRRAASE